MRSRKVRHHVLYFVLIFLLQNTNLKVENILNWQGNTQRIRTATRATNAAGPSNQTYSRTRSTPIVATNVNQGERAPTTRTRSMATQALGLKLVVLQLVHNPHENEWRILLFCCFIKDICNRLRLLKDWS